LSTERVTVVTLTAMTLEHQLVLQQFRPSCLSPPYAINCMLAALSVVMLPLCLRFPVNVSFQSPSEMASLCFVDGDYLTQRM
jgi:hypothetical protein